MRQRLLRVLPWVVALAILAYVLRTVPLSEVARAFGQAAPWAVPALALLVLAVYLADCLAIWKTFGWFVARLSFRETLLVRGATYLLAIVNYTLGQGAMIYFVHRTRGVPVLRGTAAVLLIMGINLLLLLLLASFGLLVASEIPPALSLVLPIAYAGLALYALLVIIRPRWLASRGVFDVLLSAGLGGHLKALAVRVPHLCSLVLLSYTSLRAFGVAPPFWYAVVCLPLVYFVAVLPISPQGLGLPQALMMQFFARFGPGDPAAQKATVFAAALAAQGIAVAVQLLVGVICLRSSLGRSLRRVATPSP